MRNTYLSKKNIILMAFFFISVSPIFGPVEKLSAAACIALTLILINGLSLKSDKSSLVGVVTLFIALVLYGAMLDSLNGFGIDINALGFWFIYLFSFLTATSATKEELLYANERLVILSLVVGIPIWIILSANPSMVLSTPTYTYGNFTHHTLFFVNFLIHESVSERFVGFASEPGLTQIFYTLALWFRLKRNSGNFDWQVILIIAAIFLGKSTAGLFTLMAIIALSVPKKNLIKILVMSLPFFVYFIYEEVLYHFENKLVGSDSFEYRYDRYNDFFGGNILSIILGHGNSYYSSVIANAGVGGFDSFLQVSQRYGLVICLSFFALLLLNNRRYPVVGFVVALGYFSQAIWLLPAIATLHFKNKND